MNKDEIQKLIGGYATGSLTDDERRQLFEASLDNQELFDALQGEQALKELLDDPISREQIRRAAAESLPQAKASPNAAWFRRPWIWATAASVATAAVLFVALVQWYPESGEVKQVAVVRKQAPAPQLRDETAQPRDEKSVAKMEPPVKPVQPADRRLAAKKEERPTVPETAASPAPAPPQTPPEQIKSEQAKLAEKDVVLTPPPAAPVPTETRREQADGHQQGAVTQSQPALPSPQTKDKSGRVAEMRRPEQVFRSRTIAGAGGNLAPQLAFRDSGSHSLAKRQEDGSYVNVPANTVFHPGETIRLTIVPRVSGPLVVAEWDATSSSWKLLFPPEGQTVTVREIERYTVPIDVIVKPGERLRVTVASGASEIPVEVR